MIIHHLTSTQQLGYLEASEVLDLGRNADDLLSHTQTKLAFVVETECEDLLDRGLDQGVSATALDKFDRLPPHVDVDFKVLLHEVRS